MEESIRLGRRPRSGQAYGAVAGSALPAAQHRFLDSASGLARNDSLGVMNDLGVIMPRSPSAAAADAVAATDAVPVAGSAAAAEFAAAA